MRLRCTYPAGRNAGRRLPSCPPIESWRRIRTRCSAARKPGVAGRRLPIRDCRKPFAETEFRYGIAWDQEPERRPGIGGRDFEAGWSVLVIGTLGELIDCGVGSVGFLLLMS